MTLSFGGRAIEELGFGHDLAVDPFTGATTLRIPVPVPAGRTGVRPALALVHSGGGSSPFGAGWALAGVPAVSIDTRRRLPRYDRTDRFELDGAELVPWLDADGRARGFAAGAYRVTFLRPRRGTATVRVEQWKHVATGQLHFRVRDAGNTITVFGARPAGAARIGDPNDPARVFTWLPEVQVDPHGNALWYEWQAETLDGVDRTRPEERRPAALAQRYLKRIHYGNARPLALTDEVTAGRLPATLRWCFQVVFDYGDHGAPDRPATEPDRAWLARPDPTSTGRPGFDVRTYRLCRRILAFHDLPELGETPALITSLELGHRLDPAGSTLETVTLVGHRVDDGVATRRALPPLRLTYAPAATATAFTPAPIETTADVPAGFAGTRHVLVDLFGEGLPGLLTETEQAWYWKPNLGGGRFGAQTLLAERPAARGAGLAWGDHDRDGDTELATLTGRLAGSFELDRVAQRWASFRPFAQMPRVEALGGHAQWVDLDGDGRPDVLVMTGDRLIWFPSAGADDDRELTFGAPVELPRPDGLPPVGEDPALDFFFADMNGDGLIDLVRVQNGRVEYWPGLGNGRFGPGVVMDDAPMFDATDAFDASRLRFVDLDGSGTTDLVYLGTGEVRTWSNASGNRFVEGARLDGLPILDNLASVRIVDFLGDGRPCLVWSTAATTAAASMSYLPLAPETHPRALVAVDDGRGQEIRLAYRWSGQDYLRDQTERPWTTRLPSHRSVVARREVIDHVSGTRTVTRFEYHDGHYDGAERVMRGFGHVDVFDADVIVETEPGPGAAGFAPPACTRTWFHLGTSMWNHERPGDTWTRDPELRELPPHVLDGGLASARPEDIADALRGVAGQVVRREVFAVDEHGARAPHPFEVTQSSARVRRAQPARGGASAAYEVVAGEAVTAVYEQVAGDPRVTHQLAIEVDAYGHTARDVEIAYARRGGVARDTAVQDATLVMVHDHRVVHVDQDDRFELGIPIEGRDLELAGVASGTWLTRTDLERPDVHVALATPLPHHAPWPAGEVAARLHTWERSLFWDDERSGALPLGAIGTRVLVHHEEAAVFAPSLVAATYGDRVDDARLVELGYVRDDGYWWRHDDVHRFAASERFDLPVGVNHRDGTSTTITYDPHDLVAVTVTPARGLPVTATIDYHVLAPARIVDPNGTVAEVAYDPLGVVVASSTWGDVDGQPWGHEPLAAGARLTPPRGPLAPVLADPEPYLGGASQVLLYDLDAWSRDRSPAAIVRLSRETLRHDGVGGGTPASGPIAVAVAVTYLDGAGRVLQTRDRVDPGPVVQRDASGAVVVDAGGYPVLAFSDERWRCSGGVVYDAKGRVARTYEPFFSPTEAFEGDEVLARLGVAAQTFYDAIGRVVRLDLPNGTFERTIYGPWRTEHADAGDTILESTYRLLREGLPVDDPQRQAYEHARAHHDTPTLSFVDARGQAVATVARGGGDGDRRTETDLDALGRVRAVRDPRGLTAFTYVHDMEGRLLHETSIDAGPRWALPDADDRPALTWDARGFAVETTFDALDRPVAVHVRGGGLDHVVDQRVYGEDLPVADARARNLLGQVAMVRDEAGVVTTELADPAGRPLVASRRLREDDTSEPDWRGPVSLGESFVSRARYDALGRIVAEVLPDGTRRTATYRRDGALAEVRLTTPDGILVDAPIVAGTESDARGQRARLVLGNGVEVRYEYDRETFRLARQTATRGTRRYQDLHTTFDPAGRLVRLHDRAHEGPGAVVGGAAIVARRDFVYDAHGRLVRATGRVHQALLEHDFIPGTAGPVKGTQHLSLDNGAALETYTREYSYDASGNLWRQRHVSPSQQWTTTLWVSPTSNRAIPAVDPGGNPVLDPEARFDAAGHLLRLDHLRALAWSWRGTLARAVVIARADGSDDAETYTYDADQQRVRKSWDRAVHGGSRELVEKVYLGAQERTRILRDGQVIFEKWTTHVDDGAARVALVHRWPQDDLGRETDELTTRVHYQLSTHQGSSALELDEAGEIISYEEYFPHGGTAFIAGRRARGVDIKQYRYCGKEQDDATSLYYYGYRYLAPWLGRWLIPDPVGPEDDLNLYQFVLGDPVGNVDPDGLDTVTPGKVNRVYHEFPPVTGDPVAGYRDILSRINPEAVGGFDSLSSSDKQRLATGGDNAWLVPSSPADRTGADGWAVLDRGEYALWLGQRVTEAIKHGWEIEQILNSPNPSRLGGDDAASSSSTADSSESITEEDRALIEQASESTIEIQDHAPVSPSATAATGSGGQGPSAGKGGKKAGEGGRGQGSGPGLGLGFGSGSGTDADSVIAGLRGGRTGGVPGGTPHGQGFIPGGTGDSALGWLLAGGDIAGAGGGPGGATNGSGGPGSGSSDASPGGQDGSKVTTPQGSRSDDRQRPPNAYRSASSYDYNAWDAAVTLVGAANFEFAERGKGDPNGVPGGFGSYRPSGVLGKVVVGLWAVTGIVSAFDMVGAFKALGTGLLRAAITIRRLGIRGLLRAIANLPRALLASLRAIPRRALSAAAAIRRMAMSVARSMARSIARLRVRAAVPVQAAVDPLVDASILIEAHKAWRGSTDPRFQSALALLQDPKYEWVITPTAWKEFARNLPRGSASARRFIRYLESLGNTRVMSGAEARGLASSVAFRETVTQLSAAANRATAGLGTRAGTATGKSMYNDIVQTGLARASGIPFATLDKKFFNFVTSQARAFAVYILKL